VQIWFGVFLIVHRGSQVQTYLSPTENYIMQAKDWQFPMACPLCDATAGTPYQASPEDDAVRVKVRCAKCQHVWEIVGLSLFPSLRPKPDRRRHSHELVRH
jgi:hypothetical protein